MKKKPEVILTPKTMALIPEFNKEGVLCSKVLEEDSEGYITPQSPKMIMSETMKYFGSRLDGAISSAKEILQVSSMVPVVVCSDLNMYWFPTHSPENQRCIWFSYCHIRNISSVDDIHVEIEFCDGTTLIIAIKKRRLENKFNRAGQLKHKMEERTKIKNILLYLDDVEKMFDIRIRNKKEKIKI